MLLLLNLSYSQSLIETKEFSFYKDIDDNKIDFSTFISDFDGSYEVKLIQLENVKVEQLKQTIIKQCEVKMTLSTLEDYNNYKDKDVIIKSVKGVDVSLCNGELNVNN